MKNTTWPIIAGCAAISILFGSGSAWVTTRFLTTTGTGTQLGQNIVRQDVMETNVTSEVISVAENANPSVVSIIVTKELQRYRTNPQDFMMQNPFFDGFFYSPYGSGQPNIQNPQVETERRQVAGGTGFIVTGDGKVVTNKHVVADTTAEYTVIMSDGTEYRAEVLSRDPANDLAVIQIRPEEGQSVQNLRPLPLAQAQSIRVGQVIVAIGNALGEFDNTVTMGVISAKGRSIAASDGGANGGIEQLSNLLQTDAAINPGNSGGPLLALDGTVVGVSTAIAQSANGIGFAIPVDEVDFVLRSVNKYGKIVRPFMGVVYRMNSPEIAKQFDLTVDYGAILQDGVQTGDRAVITDGPADKAGLQSGDVILEINGERLTQERDLKDTLTKFLPEDTVNLKVLRGQETLDLSLTLGKREDTTVTASTATSKDTEAAYLGVYSTSITPELQQQLSLPVSEGALLYNDFANRIPAVMQDSPAAKAGLRSGDILVTLAGEKITEGRTITSILAEKKPGDTVEVTLLRDGREERLTVTLGARPAEGEEDQK